MSGTGWAELDTVVAALHGAGLFAVAEALDTALAGAATGSEAYERVAVVLHANDASRARLSADGRRAWDTVVRRVYRDAPLRIVAYWFRRLFSR